MPPIFPKVRIGTCDDAAAAAAAADDDDADDDDGKGASRKVCGMDSVLENMGGKRGIEFERSLLFWGKEANVQCEW